MIPIRPTIAQLERHPSRLLVEFRRTAEELIAAEAIVALLVRMPTATTIVIHELSALLKQPTNSKRKA